MVNAIFTSTERFIITFEIWLISGFLNLYRCLLFSIPVSVLLIHTSLGSPNSNSKTQTQVWSKGGISREKNNNMLKNSKSCPTNLLSRESRPENTKDPHMNQSESSSKNTEGFWKRRAKTMGIGTKYFKRKMHTIWTEFAKTKLQLPKLGSNF